MVTLLHGYTVAWLHCCMVTLLHGYTVAWLHSEFAQRNHCCTALSTNRVNIWKELPKNFKRLKIWRFTKPHASFSKLCTASQDGCRISRTSSSLARFGAPLFL